MAAPHHHVNSGDPREINRVLDLYGDAIGKAGQAASTKSTKRLQTFLSGLGISTSSEDDAIDALIALLDALLDDDVLSASEKLQFIILYENTIGGYDELKKNCTDWGLLDSKEWTTYDTARNDLIAAVTALSPPFDDTSQDTPLGTGGGKILVAKFKACNDAKWAVDKLIQTTIMAQLSAILSDDVLSRAEKPVFCKAYQEAIGDHDSLENQAELWDLLSNAAWTAYDAAYNALVAAVTALVPAYDDMTQDTPLGTGGGAVLTQKFYALFTTRTTFEKVLAVTIKNTVDDIIKQLTDILSDDILSRSEKPVFCSIYHSAIAGHDQLLTLADAWGITDEKQAYVDAYTELVTIITGLTPAYNDTSQDTPLGKGGGKIILADFKALYDATANLQSAIDLRVKGVFDDIFDDDKLTPPEKVLLEQKVAQLKAQKETPITGMDAQADRYGLDRTVYDAAWTSLLSSLATLSGWDKTNLVWIDRKSTVYLGMGGGAVFRAKFDLVVSEYNALQGKIANLINGVLSDIYSDDELTPPEKQVVLTNFNNVLADQKKALLDAASAGVVNEPALTAFNKSVDALKLLLACFPPNSTDKHWDSALLTWKAGHTKDTLFLGVGGGAQLRASFLSCRSQYLALSYVLAYALMRLMTVTQATTLMADWLVKYGLIDPSTGTIDAKTKISDSSITTPLLAANIMFAKQQVIGNFDNYALNSTSEMAPPMQKDGSAHWLDVTPTSPDIEARCLHAGDARNGNYCRLVPAGNEIAISKRIPMTKGARFEAEAYGKVMKLTKPASVTDDTWNSYPDSMKGGTAQVAIVFFDALTDGKETFRFTSNLSTATNYEFLQVAMTQASYDKDTQAALDKSLSVEFHLLNQGAGDACFDDMYCRTILDGKLVVDGSITAASADIASFRAALVNAMVLKSWDAPDPADVNVDALGQWIPQGVLIQSGAKDPGQYALLVGKTGMRVGRRFIGDAYPDASNQIANGNFACSSVGWNISYSPHVTFTMGATDATGGKNHAVMRWNTSQGSTGQAWGTLSQLFNVAMAPIAGDPIYLSAWVNPGDMRYDGSYMQIKLYRLSDGLTKTWKVGPGPALAWKSENLAGFIGAGYFGVELSFANCSSGAVCWGEVSLVC